MNLKVVEIFHSIQGEGANFGMPAVFVRLANCNLDCWYCDTDFSKGDVMSVKEVLAEVAKYKCNNIIWTGGEPTLQLTSEILKQFSDYYNCIETNGTNQVPAGIDYVSCSPKVGAIILNKSFPNGVDELRYPVNKKTPPNISELPEAKSYFVSPMFLGKEKERFLLDKDNLNKCINFINKNKGWKLSLQTHKLLNLQ